MTVDFSERFSECARRIKPSAIREIARLAKQPGVISLAGGWPAAQLFPLEETVEICNDMLPREGQTALQYGLTKGDPRLLDVIAHRFTVDHGIDVSSENVMVTTGAQQGIFLLGMVLLNPKDNVLVEIPSYVGTLGVLDVFDASVIGVPMNEEGIQTVALEHKLKEFKTSERKIKYIYVVPDFQNPTGIIMSLERRKELLELSEQYDFLIIEDSPYADLRYEGEFIPPIYAMDTKGRTIFLGSFSKIFAPVRLGWVIAPQVLIDKLEIAKQQIDLCSPMLTQSIVYHFVIKEFLEAQINKTRRLYRDKRDKMLKALEHYMPDVVKWTKPIGGMFIWMTLPESLNAEEIFNDAIEEKVAFVFGSAFYPKSGEVPQNNLRLTFATPETKDIDRAIKRLARVIENYL